MGVTSEAGTTLRPPRPEEQSQTPLNRLLHGYQETLDLARGLPWKTRLRHSDGPFGRHVRVYRLRFGLRYFLLHHMNTTLAALERRYHALAALGSDPKRYDAELTDLQHFRQSLAPVPYKRLIATFVLAAGLIAGFVAEQLFPRSGAEDAVTNISDGVATLNASGVFDSYRDDPGGALLATLTVVCLLVAFVYPPVTTFRLKRRLFNLYPDGLGQLTATSARRAVAKVSGLYRLEADAFLPAQASPPREFPVDLAFQAMATVVLFPIWITFGFTANGIVKQAHGVDHGFGAVDLFMSAVSLAPLRWGITVGFAVLSPVRLYSIYRVWLRRTGRLPQERRFRSEGQGVAVLDLPFDATRITSWSRRAPAALVDVLIVLPAAAIAGGAVGAGAGLGGTGQGLVFWLVCVPLVGLAYSALMLRKGPHCGQTLGKQLFGMRVVGEDGGPVTVRTLLVREGLMRWCLFGGVAGVLLGLPLVITLVVGLLDGPNQALEDRAASTFVVDTAEAA